MDNIRIFTQEGLASTGGRTAIIACDACKKAKVKVSLSYIGSLSAFSSRTSVKGSPELRSARGA